jgi:hypothetical protein
MNIAQNVYVENGYKSRDHYLRSLAEENGVDEDTVFVLASAYGPNEDFDGLVTAVADLAEEF